MIKVLKSKLWYIAIASLGIFFILDSKAHAFDWSLSLEPGVAIPLTPPQSQLFNVGGMGTVKLHLGFGSYVDIGPTAGFVGLPPSRINTSQELGTGYMLGGGLRLKRPHNAGRDNLSAVSPWLDADVLYVRTGPLNRFGFAVGAGFSFPIGVERRFWLGPFVRYLQIVQEPTRDGYDNRDAKIITLGLSLEVGSPHKAYTENNCSDCRVVREIRVIVETVPPVLPPIVEENKIPQDEEPELKTRIQFAWDLYVIEPIWYPILDKVISILQTDITLTVQIQGHASSEGLYKHNMVLSDKRAKAVYNYFVGHGIAKERLQFKGFGSSVPVESNATATGRAANRRADFKIDLILNKGKVK